MKRFVTLLLALIPVLASAQDSPFSLDGESIIWRRVYDGTTTAGLVSYNLQASGFFRNIQASDNLVTAEMHSVKMEFKELGYKNMSLPIYLVNDTFSGFVTVQIKEDRYRVTVMRIVTHNPRLGSGSLEDLALKNGSIDPKFLDPAAIIMSHSFDGLFSELYKNTIDDEW